LVESVNRFFPVRGFGNKLKCSFPAPNANKDPVQRNKNGAGNEKVFPGSDGSIEVDYYVDRITYHQIEKTDNRHRIEKKEGKSSLRRKSSYSHKPQEWVYQRQVKIPSEG